MYQGSPGGFLHSFELIRPEFNKGTKKIELPACHLQRCRGDKRFIRHFNNSNYGSGGVQLSGIMEHILQLGQGTRKGWKRHPKRKRRRQEEKQELTFLSHTLPLPLPPEPPALPAHGLAPAGRCRSDPL